MSFRLVPKPVTVFRIKKWAFLEESLLQVSLCKNFQRQSCKAFIGLSIRPQMVGGGRSLPPEILG